MTRSGAMKLAMMLGAYFPTPPVGEETLRAYASALTDYDETLIERAIIRLVKTARFFPRIAEILDAAAEEAHCNDPAPTAEEAYAILLQAVRKFGGHRTFPSTIPHAARIKRALDQIGGWNYFCSESENLPADRARFIDAYGGVVQREGERLTLGIEPPRFEFKGPAQLEDEARAKRLLPPTTESVTGILERLRYPAASSEADTPHQRRPGDGAAGHDPARYGATR